jgi:hypothetical protein
MTVARGPVLLIDGRSGSGKTELAAALVAESPQVQLLRLDDLYPGWDGLEQGSVAALELLVARRLDDRPSWRRWDWATGDYAEWHDVDPTRPLVVEGCGALTRSARRRADFGLWVELDAEQRKRRALARDGETFAPHWDDWAAQEDAHIARDDPRGLADAIVDGNDVRLQLARWRGILDADSVIR